MLPSSVVICIYLALSYSVTASVTRAANPPSTEVYTKGYYSTMAMGSTQLPTKPILPAVKTFEKYACTPMIIQYEPAFTTFTTNTTFTWSLNLTRESLDRQASFDDVTFVINNIRFPVYQEHKGWAVFTFTATEDLDSITASIFCKNGTIFSKTFTNKKSKKGYTHYTRIALILAALTAGIGLNILTIWLCFRKQKATTTEEMKDVGVADVQEDWPRKQVDAPLYANMAGEDLYETLDDMEDDVEDEGIYAL